MTDDRTKLPPGVTFVCDDRGTPIGVVLDPDSDFAGRSKGNEDEADDVWAMVDRWRAEGAEKERERLNLRAAEILSGEARGARSGRTETWSNIMLGIAALNDITIERLLVEERERLAKNAAKVFGVGQFYLLGRAIQEWIIEGGKDPSQ